MSANQDKDKIRAERRRRIGTGPRERAQAPERRETPTGQGIPPGVGGKPPSGIPTGGGFSFGKGGKTSIIGIIIFVVIVCVAIALGGKFDLFGSGSQTVEQNENQNIEGGLIEEPTEPFTDIQTKPTATTRPKATAKPAGSTGAQTWTVMLYQDADDNILEQDIYVDLNEAERIGSTDRVNIIAQTDRFQGAYRGDGNWTETRRYYITQDNDLQAIHSELLNDLGEANMSDRETLVDFVVWTVQNYPADKYVLILSDHGMGWPGGWSDPDPGGRGDASIPLASRLGNQLFLHELDQALTEIRNKTEIDQFELVGMDACLMGQLEVYSMLSAHARYAVASEEIEPALGWAYSGFLEELTSNPDIDGAQLAKKIVDSYIQQDQRIVDDEARAEFLRQSAGAGGLFGFLGEISPEQLTAQLEQGITISAIDLASLQELMTAVNQFAFVLQKENQSLVAKARTYAQSFTSIFGNNVPPSYIDLGNFVKLIRKESRNRDVQSSADVVIEAIQNAVIAEKHGPKKPGSTGVAIYFPNSQLYNNVLTGAESYTAIANQFSSVSLWDEFLAFHYNNRSFKIDTAGIALPDRTTGIRSPGSGNFSISSVDVSANQVSPGGSILVSADINGQNIGYIYLFVGYFDQVNNSINVIDIDYLESDETREIDGIYYPIWSESNSFTLEFEWEPVVFAIQAGDQREVALFNPKVFGASFEEAVYAVDCIYRFADGSDPVNARLHFINGELRQVYGISGEGDTGAPREIIPQTGDSITILEKWLDLDASGKITQQISKEAGTLTFGPDKFRWVDLDAAAGNYIIGFIVGDLDGNIVQSFTQIEVK